MANEVKVTTEIVINSSVTGITRKSRILESYEDDLGDFDTPEGTGSTTIDALVSADNVNTEIGAPFTYATGDILFIKNTGVAGVDSAVDIGLPDSVPTGIFYFARLQPGQHLTLPIGPDFATSMFAQTSSGTTTISVTVVQTS
jgi:hypothetical protein